MPPPERWHMYDSMTPKPNPRFLEGDRHHHQTRVGGRDRNVFRLDAPCASPEGLKANGFGRVITCEYDAKSVCRGEEPLRCLRLAE